MQPATPDHAARGDAIPPFWTQLRAIALYPLQGAALASIAALSLVSLLTGLPGIGLVLWALLWVGAYKYAFEILRCSADGRDQPPEVITSAETGTVLRFLGLQVVFVLAVVATLLLLGPAAMVALLLLLTIAQPGATISLAIDGSLPHALNPSTWFSIMGRIGWPYLAVVVLLFVFQASAANAEALFAKVLPGPLAGIASLALTLWGLFATFRLMGYMVLQYHEPLGWQPQYLQLQEARRDPDQALLEHASSLVQDGQTQQARALLAEELRTRAVTPAVHELYRKLLRLANDRPALLEHSRLYINLLMVSGGERKALDLLREALLLDRGFVPLQEEHGIALVAAADRRGDSQLALDLRLALHAAYPRHPLAARWATDAARLLVDKFGREQDALRLLDRSEAQVPEDDAEQREDRERLRTLVTALTSGPAA
jgi:tetratricopeptide (TPR) repeat protein